MSTRADELGYPLHLLRQGIVARRGQWPAAKAGAETGVLRLRCGVKEEDVFGFGRARRTRGAAKDTRGFHCIEEGAIGGGVARLHACPPRVLD